MSFAGFVAGSLFVSIDHGGGVVSTSSWISAVSVRKGDSVRRGALIGRTGHGHPEVAAPHVHFSVRLNGVYVDPMAYLGAPDLVTLIRLVPLNTGETIAPAARAPGAPPAGSAGTPPRMTAPSDPGCRSCHTSTGPRRTVARMHPP